MNHSRFLILTFGPVAVVALAYAVAFPRRSTAESILISPVTAESTTTSVEKASRNGDDLTRICEMAAQSLKQQLPTDFQLVVCVPFVIAGDLPKARLKTLHSEIIAPVTRALQATYFERPPSQPIRIVVCSTEERFRQLAREWDGHLEGAYHGYYQRDKRRILLDLEAGNGSLAHELTHALSQSDCENLPEWFDEGLGALHEDASFTSNSRSLIGQPNWRCRITRQALQSERLPSLSTLAKPGDFRTGDVEVRYAMARSLCLFLQEQGLLAKYYKDLRKHPEGDNSGLKTLCRVLQVRDVSVAERQFHDWVRRPAKSKG